MVWETATPNPNDPFGALRAFEGPGIDLRAVMERCLEDHGHNVFLRSPTGQVCACRKRQDDPIHPSPHDEFDIHCPDCQGFGYYYEDVKMRAYRRPAFGTFGFTGGLLRSPVGNFGVADTVWYFKHTEKSVVGHHIIEVTVDDDGDVVKAENIERIHEIRQSHLARERRGRPEFWEVLCREILIGK
jgi:hypothetical protein